MTNRSYFPPRALVNWSKNWLDGSGDWFYALFDTRVYDMYVRALRERYRVILHIAGTAPGTAAGQIEAILATDLPFAQGATSQATVPTNGADFILGNAYPGGGNPSPGSFQANVGWHKLSRFAQAFLDGGGNESVVRVADPTNYAEIPAYTVGTEFYYSPTLFNAPVNGTGAGSIYLTRHLPDYYVRQRKPREIQKVTDPGTNGQSARLVGGNHTNGVSGQLFSYTGGATWVQDDAKAFASDTSTSRAGLPDVIETGTNRVQAAMGTNTAFSPGGLATSYDDRVKAGDYFDAYFLQRLRDKIDGAVGFYEATSIPKSGTFIGLADGTYYSGTDSASWSGVTQLGWPYVNTNNSGTIERQTASFVVNNIPNAGSYSCQLYMGTFGIPWDWFTAPDFNAYGDPVTSIYDASGTAQLDKTQFFLKSGIIASSATAYTTANVFSGTFPSGTDKGWRSFFDSSPGGAFCVFRFDVSGGFTYVHGYAGT